MTHGHRINLAGRTWAVPSRWALDTPGSERVQRAVLVAICKQSTPLSPQELTFLCEFTRVSPAVVSCWLQPTDGPYSLPTEPLSPELSAYVRYMILRLVFPHHVHAATDRRYGRYTLDVDLRARLAASNDALVDACTNIVNDWRAVGVYEHWISRLARLPTRRRWSPADLWALLRLHWHCLVHTHAPAWAFMDKPGPRRVSRCCSCCDYVP